MRLEEHEHTSAAPFPCGRERGRAPSAGCARSRRRRRSRPQYRRARTSGRRPGTTRGPQPLRPAGRPPARAAATATAALRRLCSPGTASSESSGASSQPRTTSGTSPSHRSKELLHLRTGAELGVVVEVDVRHHRHLRAQRKDRPVRLVSLDHEPPLPRAGVRAELGHLAADDPARVTAGRAQRERDHGRGRRLAVRAGDDDRPARSDELREQLRPGTAGDIGIGAGDEHLPPVRRLRLRRDRHVDPRLADWAEVRGLVPVPAGDLRSPGPRQQRVRRTDPRRRSRPARFGAPQVRASAINSSAISSAAAGFDARRIACPIAASRPPSDSRLRTTPGTRAISGSGTTTAPPACSK